jgi:hypothetical protein
VQCLHKFNLLFFDMKTVYVGKVSFEIGFMEEILLYVVEAKFSRKEKVGMIKPLFSGWFRFGGEFKNYIFDKVEFENEKLDGGRAIFLEGTDQNTVIERAVALKKKMTDALCGFIEEVRVSEREDADVIIGKMRSEIEAAE